jgi:hypothetical protein
MMAASAKRTVGGNAKKKGLMQMISPRFFIWLKALTREKITPRL